MAAPVLEEEKKLNVSFKDTDDDSTLDPRVSGELHKLNDATDTINRLETQLDEARAEFRQALTDSTQKLNALAKTIGKGIDDARPYYDARMRAKEAQAETQKAAIKFERANSMHAGAKEMVFLSEQGLKKDGRSFDAAWQEMLNHATGKVNEAERERNLSQKEHFLTSQVYNTAEQQVKIMQRQLKRPITKSRPYFELKAKLNQQLEEQKQRVGHLECEIQSAKDDYSKALKSLEGISDEIHEKRKIREIRAKLGIRSEGVGAEDPEPPPGGHSPQLLPAAPTLPRKMISLPPGPGEEMIKYHRSLASVSRWLEECTISSEDTESLASTEMLDDEQIAQLMLDRKEDFIKLTEDGQSITKKAEKLLQDEIDDEPSVLKLMNKLESEQDMKNNSSKNHNDLCKENALPKQYSTDHEDANTMNGVDGKMFSSSFGEDKLEKDVRIVENIPKNAMLGAGDGKSSPKKVPAKLKMEQILDVERLF